MSAIPVACTTGCKSPTYYLHELFFRKDGTERERTRKVYRDRCAMVNEKCCPLFVGKDHAITIFLYDDSFYYRKKGGKNKNIFVLLQKVFWDKAWKPVRPSINDDFFFEPSSKQIKLSLPCTCKQPEMSLDEITTLLDLNYSQSFWAYRDRPVVVYQQGPNQIYVHFDFEHCGIGRRVQVMKGESNFLILNRNDQRIPLPISFHDRNWKVFFPSKDGALEAYADTHFVGKKEKEESDKRLAEEKDQIVLFPERSTPSSASSSEEKDSETPRSSTTDVKTNETTPSSSSARTEVVPYTPPLASKKEELPLVMFQATPPASTNTNSPVVQPKASPSSKKPSGIELSTIQISSDVPAIAHSSSVNEDPSKASNLPSLPSIKHSKKSDNLTGDRGVQISQSTEASPRSQRQVAIDIHDPKFFSEPAEPVFKSIEPIEPQVEFTINGLFDPEYDSDDDEEAEKQVSCCQKICCCFKRCFPSYF